MPPPHGLLRGNTERSRRRTGTPADARVRAAVAPAGPAPTTITGFADGRGDEPGPGTRRFYRGQRRRFLRRSRSAATSDGSAICGGQGADQVSADVSSHTCPTLRTTALFEGSSRPKNRIAQKFCQNRPDFARSRNKDQPSLPAVQLRPPDACGIVKSVPARPFRSSCVLFHRPSER